MKKITTIAFFFSTVLILSMFTNVSASKCVTEELNEKIQKIIEEKEESKWFPGFMIVQLIKGAIALVLVLLVLFDLIEPDESEGQT